MRARVILACACAACAPDRPVHVPWPEGSFAAAFLVEAEGTGVRNLDGPFQLPSDAVPSEPRSVERAVPDNGELRLIAVEAEGLERMSPTWRYERPEDLALLTEPESCTDGRVELREEGTPRYVPLTGVSPEVFTFDGVSRFVPGAADEAWLDGLSMRVPEDLTRCVETARTLTPFGARLSMFEPISSVLGHAFADARISDSEREAWTTLGRAAWIEDDRAVSISRRAAFLFHRGRDFIDDERHVFLASRFEDPAAPGRVFEPVEIALDPRSPVQGRARVVILLLHRLPDASVDSRTLVELWIDPSGFAEPRILATTDHDIQDILFEPSGRFIAVGEAGLVLFIDPDSGQVTERTLELDTRLLWKLLLTGEPERPHIVFTRGSALFLGDLEHPSRGLFVPSQRGSFAEAVAGAWLPRLGQEGQVLVSTYDSGYYLYDLAEGWRPGHFDAPESARPCAGSLRDCGRPSFEDRFLDFAQTDSGTLLTFAQGCKTVFELDPRKRCVEPVLAPEETSAERATTRVHFRTLTRRDTRLLLSGREGVLAELR